MRGKGFKKAQKSLDNLGEHMGSKNENFVPLRDVPFSPELIVFLEIDPKAIVELIKDVEPICNHYYPYEYHLTVGWFTDENQNVLRQWGPQTVDFVKDRTKFPSAIEINGAYRHPLSRGGGFYLQLADQTNQEMQLIHQELHFFLKENGISACEKIINYILHVTFTAPVSLETVNSQQETRILEALNHKISHRGAFVLHPTAIRTILKYLDLSGNECREIWDHELSSLKRRAFPLQIG
jgi:hypothetical protein